MTLPYTKKYISKSKYTRPGTKLVAVKKIVMHYTASPEGTAINHYRYFSNLNDRYASAHIFVDKNEALAIVPIDEVAYHANDVQERIKGIPYRGVSSLKPNANLCSLGIEMCIEKDGSIHENTFNKAVDVAAYLCKKHGLISSDIVRHYDITHKNCPAPWVSDESEFVRFKKAVAAKLGETTSALVKPSSTSSTKKLEILVNNLKTYKSAKWNDYSETIVSKGEVYTVVDTLTVDGSKMYKLKSGLYITGNSKYVKVK